LASKQKNYEYRYKMESLKKRLTVKDDLLLDTRRRVAKEHLKLDSKTSKI
jgi:hypothetical protein